MITNKLKTTQNTIYYLTNDKNIGDNATAEAIANKIKLSEVGYMYDLRKLSSDHFNLIQDSLDDNDIIIGSGRHNFEILVSTNAISIWSSHQLHAGFEGLINQISLVAIPEHELTTEKESLITTKMVKTIGVAHSKTAHAAISAYSTFVMPQQNRYNLLILGGDAPNRYGEMEYFTEQNAVNISEYVKKTTQEETCTLLTNCHRTGRHCKKEHEDIDSISQLACEVFSDYSENYFKMYNYNDPNSNYLALLGAICLHEESLIFIPGDSISIISEALSIIPAKNIYIYDTDSMSESHHSFVASIISHFNINHLIKGESGYLKSPSTISFSEDEVLYNASDKIYESALELIINPKDYNNEKLQP
jgi:hypothetical protein